MLVNDERLRTAHSFSKAFNIPKEATEIINVGSIDTRVAQATAINMAITIFQGMRKHKQVRP